MAKINFGTIANDARGKINGTVYSKNKSGAYVRKKVTPANPRTTAQTTMRQYFAQLSQAWSGTLTASQRAAWIAFAQNYPRNDIFGASIGLSGINMYVALGTVMLLGGETPSATPPGSNVVTPIPTSSVAGTITHPGTLKFEQTGAAASTDLAYWVFAARPLPAGVIPQKSDFRFICQATALVSAPGPVDVSANYTNKFGAFAEGQQIALLVATVDTTSGLLTTGQVISGIAS
jgi:hypothetical protein